MIKHAKLKIAILACLTLGLLCGSPAWSATNIKLPFKVSMKNIRGQLMQQFADQVKQATNGRYTVTLYPGGQLYSGGTSVAQAVQLGNVQMASPPNSAFTGNNKAVDLLEVPFAFRKPADYWKFMDGQSAQAIFKQLNKVGFVGLAMFGEGPFVIGTKKHLIKKPADLKGEVIRTSGHKVVVDALRTMGASTVKIDFPEIYSALQQGTITGVYTTFDAYISDKMYEVAPHVMLFPAHGAYLWVANKQWWSQQPSKDRQIIKRIARKLADKYDHEVWSQLDENIATLKKHGGDYFDPTREKASLQDFRSAIKPVYGRLKQAYGNKVIEDLLAGNPISPSELAGN